MIRVWTAGLCGLVMCLPACQEPVAQEGSSPGQMTPLEAYGRGEAMAETLCVSCHAIGHSGSSLHPDALPFRQLSWRYPVMQLRESLAEGIMVGHPDMPEWQFEAGDIEALLTYIETVQQPRPS